MLSTFLAYLRNPDDNPAPPSSLGTRGRALWLLLVYDLVFAFAASIVIGLIGETGLVDLENHAMVDALEQMEVWQLLLLAVLVGPLFEELIFRLPLRFETNPITGIIRVFTPSTGTEADDELRALRRANWQRNYRYIFYGLAIAFALIHLFNYPDWSLGLLLVSPIIVAPQFVMGSMAGFLRVRYGFWWAYLLHMLHNFVLVGGLLLAPEEMLEAGTESVILPLLESLIL